MKRLMTLTLSVLFLSGGAVGCAGNRSVAVSNTDTYQAGNNTDNTKETKMKIKIGSKTFSATLFENETAEAFKKMLPLTVKMEELNGNEKKHDFPNSLPTDSSNPKTITSGDLMIWGSNTLVLFYKSFPTQYSYTKLGKIHDASELEAAVGAGDVTVSFELE